MARAMSACFSLRRGGIKESARISLIPPLLTPQLRGGGGGGGGFTVENKQTAISQLRALATRTPSLGRVGQGAWELGFAQTRRCYFFSDPCVFGYIF